MSALNQDELEAMNIRSKQLQASAANIVHQSGNKFKRLQVQEQSRYAEAAAEFYSSSKSGQVQQCLRSLIDNYVRPVSIKPSHYTFIRYFNSEEQAL